MAIPFLKILQSTSYLHLSNCHVKNPHSHSKNSSREKRAFKLFNVFKLVKRDLLQYFCYTACLMSIRSS